MWLPRRRLPALLAAALALGAAVPARADTLSFARSLLAGGSGGSTVPSPTATDQTPTILDVAGAATPVTLPDLLQLSVRQAPALAQARIDIEIADAQIESSRAVSDWTVGANAGATAKRAPVSPLKSATTLGAGVGANLGRIFDSGGQLALDASAEYGRDITDNANLYTDNVTATFTQPLERGAGKAIVLAREEEAAISRDASALARRQAAIAEVRDVVQNYWELLYAQRDLEIRHSSLELARESLRRTQAGISGGGLARTEALAAEQVIATREEEVLASELALVDQSITLRRLVGMEIGPHQLALSTTGDLDVPDKSWNLDALVDEAYKTSPELAQLVAQGKNAKIEVEVTENGVLPSLDLAVNGGLTGVADGPLTAAKDVVTADQYTAGITLTYQKSLGNHAATGAARQARAQVQKLKIDEFDTRAQIAEALTEAVLLAETARKRIDLAAEAVDLAKQNIAAEQSRFQLGKSTNFDVLQRQNELEQAQLRQARAIVDWHKAATVISSISGELLGDFGVTVE